MGASTNTFPSPGKSRHLFFFLLSLVLVRRKNQWHLPSQAAASILSLIIRSCQTLQCSRTGEKDTNSLSNLGEVEELPAWINSFLPQEEAESWDFLSTHSVQSWGGDESMVYSKHHLHCCLRGLTVLTGLVSNHFPPLSQGEN